MARLALLVIAYVLGLTILEVDGTCRNYCDYRSTGQGTKPCTKKQSQQGTSYRRCGLLWASRCKKGTYTYYSTVNACCKRTCRVNGRWEDWSSWSLYSSCSRSCGTGTKKYVRQRHCTNPSPKNGGNSCYGRSVEYKHRTCFNKYCPVNCHWRSWGSWSYQGGCSVSCGGGTRTIIRTRSSSEARYGGKVCSGKSQQTRERRCNVNPCSDDGGWSSWSSWKKLGTCPVTCGVGETKYVRTRACDNPTPSRGGKECEGSKTDIAMKMCSTTACPAQEPTQCKARTCSQHGKCGCTFGFYGNGFSCKGSRGKRFLLLFMETISDLQSDLANNRSTEIHVAALADSKLTLKSSSENIKSLPFSAGKAISQGVSKLEIPMSFRTTDLKTERKAIMLESSTPVSVVTLNHDGYSSDSSLILPVERLGRKYVVGSTDPFSNRDKAHSSQVAIAALQDKTTVTVQLKFKSNSSLAYQNKQYFSGDKIAVNLNRFESFQLSERTDLTGTFVEANHPVAVFAGNRCNKLQRYGFCSHLMEQLPPIEDLDTEYIVPPSLETSGTRIRMVASQRTRVEFFFNGGKREKILEPGTYKDAEFHGEHSVHLKADKPLMVLSFAIRMARGGEGDPYMSLVPGFNQYLSQYFVLVPGGYTKNFLSIIMKADSKSSLRIDGKQLSKDDTVSEIKVVASHDNYLVYVVRTSPGGHKVETLDNSRFGLMIHGQTDGDSYGYAANVVKVS
ncbi:uncharacterized protein LOC111107180 [Crassostrea virginica]